MGLPSGVHRFGSSNGRLVVRTGRAGVAARAGHDLTIEASSWSAVLTIDAARPEGSTLTVTVDARSLEVREGTGGMKALTDRDRADIRATMAAKVLHSDRHPEISFTSTSIAAADGSGLDIVGALTIAGTTRPVQFGVAVAADGLTARASIVQSEWGIRPFSAMMGSLKVADRVEIEAQAGLEPS